MNTENEDIKSASDVTEEAEKETAQPSPTDDAPAAPENSADNTDYAELVKADMQELSMEFSTKDPLKITDLKNPLRYGALRDLGLTPKEAFLASGGKKERADNRAHLSSSVPRKISTSFTEIPRAELDAARELFGDISDTEIRNLYKKVTQ